MKQLIVNADDLGLTPGINRGILQGFQHGIVTSASLLVTAGAFEDAVGLARQFPGLDVGLHLALVEEPSVLGREALPTLVNAGGRLPTRSEFFRRALLGRINWEEVEREIAAQIARFQATGLPLSHIDSHQHLHIFPPIFEILCRRVRRLGNVWIRNPAGPWGKATGVSMKRWAQGLGLNLISRWARGFRHPSGLRMPDGMLGFDWSGSLDRAALARILRQVPEGLYELVCHPGEADDESGRRYGAWGYRWAEELEGLVAPETKLVLEEEGIVLTSFRRPGEPVVR